MLAKQLMYLVPPTQLCELIKFNDFQCIKNIWKGNTESISSSDRLAPKDAASPSTLMQNITKSAERVKSKLVKVKS